jgi:twitching motility protein PilT
VGELRDLETIRLALTAAETGHLVFATLHTSSAAKTIDRVVDVFPPKKRTWCAPCCPNRSRR